jgi:hypothetical protein
MCDSVLIGQADWRPILGRLNPQDGHVTVDRWRIIDSKDQI